MNGSDPVNGSIETLLSQMNLNETSDLVSRLESDGEILANQLAEIVRSNGSEFLAEANLTNHLKADYDLSFKLKFGELNDWFEKVFKAADLLIGAVANKEEKMVDFFAENDQIFNLLHLPDLIRTCVDHDRYEDGFDLICSIRTLAEQYPRIAILQKLYLKARCLQEDLYRKVFTKLRTNPDLSLVFQMISFLRQNTILSSSETDVEFLRIRNAFLMDKLNGLENEPQNDVLARLSKTIEIYRSSLYETITQFDVLESLEPNNNYSHILFKNWLVTKIHEFVGCVRESLEKYYANSIAATKSIYDQCRNFTDSLDRLGYDFRSEIEQMFGESLLKKRFAKILEQAENEFRNGTMAIDEMEWPSNRFSRRPQLVGNRSRNLYGYCLTVGSILCDFEQFFLFGFFSEILTDLRDSLDRLNVILTNENDGGFANDRFEICVFFRDLICNIFDANSFAGIYDCDLFRNELVVYLV